MHIEGDIKIWSDGHKVCARLRADGPEGPIVIQAAAPIGPVRRKMARILARQGVNVSGSEPAFSAKVQQAARRKALKRLQRMAPGAFRKGGLGPYLAQRELLKRKKRRRAVAKTKPPLGAKPVGRLPSKKGGAPAKTWGGRLRVSAARMLPGASPRALLPAPLKKLPSLPANAVSLVRPSVPFMTSASALSSPSSAMPRGSGGGGGGGASKTSAPQSYAERRDEEDVEEAASEEAEGASEADDGSAEGQSDAEASASDEGEDDAQEPQGDDPAEAAEEEGVQDEEGVSGYGYGRRYELARDRERRTEARRALAINRLRSAMRLLEAAHHDPKARRRIVNIAAMAGEGHPAAKKSFKALTVAHKLQKKAQARAATKALAKSSKAYGKALPSAAVKPQGKALVKVAKPRPTGSLSPRTLPAPMPSPAPSPPFAPGTPAEAVRWWDILAAWRRGMG